MPPSTNASDMDWRRILRSLQMELISRGGSEDSIVGIREVLVWFEGERIRLDAQYQDLLDYITPKIAEAKRDTRELLEQRVAGDRGTA